MARLKFAPMPGALATPIEARHPLDIHRQMPGSMDGLKLAHFVKDRWPPIKIIATSGHARIADNDLTEGSCFLRKPYAVAEIASAIDRLIRQ